MLRKLLQGWCQPRLATHGKPGQLTAPLFPGTVRFTLRAREVGTHEAQRLRGLLRRRAHAGTRAIARQPRLDLPGVLMESGETGIPNRGQPRTGVRVGAPGRIHHTPTTRPSASSRRSLCEWACARSLRSTRRRPEPLAARIPLVPPPHQRRLSVVDHPHPCRRERRVGFTQLILTGDCSAVVIPKLAG